MGKTIFITQADIDAAKRKTKKGGKGYEFKKSKGKN